MPHDFSPAKRWLEDHLLTAADHCDLEQNVFDAGALWGYGEPELRQCARTAGVSTRSGLWTLSDLRVEALQIRRRLAMGPWRPSAESDELALGV